ncbi:MAG: PilZ domain-containing protein [Acidobacteriia bacterium]|nr:PilZ domain-containing protein [Terriglobia bacterium]
MSLHALVVGSDEKIVRVLRRVLSDLEIGIDTCQDSGAAVHKLSRQRYEAVIVDCADEHMASQVLRSARSAPCNKRAVAVAVIDGQTAVRSAFALGAHFVLYKPISTERAKSSFRAVRALMKRERRRNTRLAVQIPVVLTVDKGSGQQKTVTTDLSEGGMAIQLSRRPGNAGAMRAHFTLPGTDCLIDCAVEVAWGNAGRQAGIRFVDLAPESHRRLKAWLNSHSPETEKDDPPVACKLTDLSLGGCYLEMTSPFPVKTRVVLSMRVAEAEVQVEGVVRVMHPEVGMGVLFRQKTTQQREQVEKFIQALMSNRGDPPELLVEPEGLDTENVEPRNGDGDADDPLVELFHTKADLSTDAFLIELRRQRGPNSDAARASASS